MDSKAKLNYARGMNNLCVRSKEFEDEGAWHRCELYVEDEGGIKGAAYTRIGAYWKPASSQMLAMQIKGMLNQLSQEGPKEPGEDRSQDRYGACKFDGSKP